MERNATCAATTSARSISASAKTMCGDLPPHSKVQRFRLPAARCHDLARGGVAAGEGYLVDARVRRQRRARGRAVARDHVEHAGREAGLLHKFGYFERRHWRLLGGLDHQRIAGRQRRTDLPGIEQDRGIPRQHGADHAHRLAARIGQRVRLEGDLFAGNLVGGPGEENQPVDGAAHLAHRVAQRLAIVPAFQLRQARGIAAQEFGEFQQQCPALAGGDPGLPWPGHGGARGRDGIVHVGLVRFGDFGPDLFGRRIDGGDRPPRMRRHPLSPDIEPVIGSHGHCSFFRFGWVER